jgi:hypothetical protein
MMFKKTLGAPLQKFLCRGGLFYNQTVIHEKRFAASPAAGVKTHEFVVAQVESGIAIFRRAGSSGPKGGREFLNRHPSFFLSLDSRGQSIRDGKSTHEIFSDEQRPSIKFQTALGKIYLRSRSVIQTRGYSKNQRVQDGSKGSAHKEGGLILETNWSHSFAVGIPIAIHPLRRNDHKFPELRQFERLTEKISLDVSWAAKPSARAIRTFSTFRFRRCHSSIAWRNSISVLESDRVADGGYLTLAPQANHTACAMPISSPERATATNTLFAALQLIPPRVRLAVRACTLRCVQNLPHLWCCPSTPVRGIVKLAPVVPEPTTP